jgi:hypothetical protein
MANKKSTIKTIRIAMGNTEVDLTPEKARSLRDALNEIYAEPQERIVPQPSLVPQPYPVWPPRIGPYRWGTWCASHDNTSGTLTVSNVAP